MDMMSSCCMARYVHICDSAFLIKCICHRVKIRLDVLSAYCAWLLDVITANRVINLIIISCSHLLNAGVIARLPCAWSRAPARGSVMQRVKMDDADNLVCCCFIDDMK